MCPVCPTCNLPYDPEQRTVELGDMLLRPDARELVYEGRATKLLPVQVKFMACLMRQGGEATLETLFRACARSQESHIGIVKTHASYLRTRFKEAGLKLEIHSIGGKAYRLSPGPE